LIATKELGEGRVYSVSWTKGEFMA
jgi:hypothetical protein